jgi:chromosome segregation protein
LEQEKLRASADRDQHVAQAAQAKAHVDRLTVDLDSLGAKKQEIVEKNFQASEESRAAMALAASMRDQLRESEVERVRVESRRAVANQKLLEEYGMDENDARSTAQNEAIPENGASEAQRLRREIRAMGEVNLGAIEAFARLNERYGELGLQRDDVQQGMDEITAGIEELDKLTKDRFRDTFYKVRDQFQEMLVKLFQGGEGTLILTDPENLLESGVDVEVTIPGKKRQRLELLSGGERALAASAFLFSLLRVKPSPLVVLDEVDAPLDGRNVERFVTVMKEFSGQIQFVCITHNPQTIGAAPMWFGVTMQEPGVSTVIPYKTLQPEERERVSMKG